MKYEAKKSTVMKWYTCYSIGYGELQHLLTFEEPESYTCGMYGWNADVYDAGKGRAIVTGYRPFGKRVNYKIVDAYDQKAKKILNGKRYKKNESKQNALKKLFAEMMDEIEGSC